MCKLCVLVKSCLQEKERHDMMICSGFREVNGMNEMMNLLLAVVKTGDDANMGKWVVIMVVVGVLLVALAVVSVISSKKKKAEAEQAEKKSADKE